MSFVCCLAIFLSRRLRGEAPQYGHVSTFLKYSGPADADDFGAGRQSNKRGYAPHWPYLRGAFSNHRGEGSSWVRRRAPRSLRSLPISPGMGKARRRLLFATGRIQVMREFCLEFATFPE